MFVALHHRAKATKEDVEGKGRINCPILKEDNYIRYYIMSSNYFKIYFF